MGGNFASQKEKKRITNLKQCVGIYGGGGGAGGVFGRFARAFEKKIR